MACEEEGAHPPSWRAEDDDVIAMLRGLEPIGDQESGGGGAVPSSGMLGVLRYKRESLDPWTQLPEPQNQPLRDSPVICDYCGHEGRPSLDFAQGEDSQLFCCGQHQQLCEILARERRLMLERPDLEDTPLPVSQPTREEEAGLQAQQATQREERRKQKQERERLSQEHSAPLPVETYPSQSKTTLSYQLSSCAPRELQWRLTPDPGATLEDPDLEQNHRGGSAGLGEGQKDPLYDARCSQFGLAHHQAGSGLLQRYYPNGRSFLTVFPDGSAQLYYPSGLMALVLVVDRGRRVCLVYDDHAYGEQPIRALFHSDGRATCYHANGSVWLSLDSSGGQCVSEEGSRLRRWSWVGPGPAPLRPVFLSLNPRLGVRVLGRGHISVSFLALGRQARFSVGACVQAAERKGPVPAHGPSISREELFLFAGRIGVHLGIRRLQQCLRAPSSPRPLRLGPAAAVLGLARRLLDWSCRLGLGERERAFVHSCLQDCL